MADVLKYIKENKFFVISVFAYIVITLPFMLSHIPWYDEAHAYMQAYFMNIHNWTSIVSAEGHPLLWFLLIMPFAKFNWHYPYPMLIINYIFCIGSIIVLWTMSPFNKWIKLVITFSSMYIIYFPVVARGYSLGILLLFLLSALYKNKLQHPILYPVLVALTLNLNIICGIGASWFGLIFFIDLLKSSLNTKTKVISTSILVLSTLLFIFPFLGGFGTAACNVHESAAIKLGNLKHFFTTPILRLILYVGSLIYVFAKTKLCNEQTLIIYTNILLFSIFAFFYPGGPHHFIFVFIYLITYLWIYIDKFPEVSNTPCKDIKPDILSLMLMILLLMPLQSDLKDIYYGNKMHTKELATILNSSPQYRNSRLFLYEREALIIPYLKDDIELYSACTTKALGWDMYDTHDCVSSEELKAALYDKNKNTYLFVAPSIHSKNFDNEFKILEFKSNIN